MSAVLEFLPEAKCDADEATRFYERRVPGLGARFRAEVESVCAAIVRQPLLWRERRGGYLVQQGLEEVVVRAVEHKQFHRIALERARSIQSAESAANDGDSGCHL